MKLQQFVLVCLVAAAAVAGLAMEDAGLDTPVIPKPSAPSAGHPSIPQAKWFPVSEALLPHEAVVAAESVAPDVSPARVGPDVSPAKAGARSAPAAQPAIKRVARLAPAAPAPTARARIKVEARRLDGDQRLQAAAMKAIAGTSHLSGRIGVETRDSIVRLSGWTATGGQALRAEKAVARLRGVRGVVNQIRPRIGPVMS